MEISERIKAVRKEAGLTQQEFADRLGIARGNIGAYEVGKNAPSDAVIALICKTFGVNEAWLRNGEGEMFRQLSREEEIEQMAQTLLAEESDSFRTRLVSVLVRLSPEKLEVLADIAEGLVAAHDQEPAAPVGVDPDEAELQRKVADYERELREEQEARRRSEASPDTSETA